MNHEKYINEFGKECWRNVTIETPFKELEFYEVPDQHETDRQWALHTNLGSLTVLNRMTGYGNGMRDTETGWRDKEGKFWLASGGCDVRFWGGETFGDAVEWVKRNSNTCMGE